MIRLIIYLTFFSFLICIESIALIIKKEGDIKHNSKSDEGYDFDENLIDSNQETKFLNRFNGIEEHIRKECLETYVRPMVNKKKARS